MGEHVLLCMPREDANYVYSLFVSELERITETLENPLICSKCRERLENNKVILENAADSMSFLFE